MKVVVLRNNLNDGLRVMGKISTEGTGVLPILKNFLIETLNNKIKLSSTNLEMALTVFISGKIIENGGITIPLNVFGTIIGNLQAERINLESDGDNLVVKTDNYEAKIQGLKKEDFPIIPQIQNEDVRFDISASRLKESFAFVVTAAQSSGLRPELNGVLFAFENGVLKIAATDSFRLAETTLNENQFNSTLEQGFRVIIPLKTAQEIARILNEGDEKVSLYFNHNQVFLKTESAQAVSRLTAGEFPDYAAIIPKDVTTEIVLKNSELIGALKLASAFTGRLNEVRIRVKDGAKNIEVFSAAQNLGENNYLIPAKIKGVGAEVVFNWRLLLDGLKGFGAEDVLLGLSGDDKPAIVKSVADASAFYILAPLKSA